jgi:hypothetical protein
MKKKGCRFLIVFASTADLMIQIANVGMMNDHGKLITNRK